MSLRAVARQHGNRGAGRTRFPSVNALSEFSHNQGQPLTKTAAGADPRAALGLLSEADQIAGSTCTQPKCQVRTPAPQQSSARRTATGVVAFHGGAARVA